MTSHVTFLAHKEAFEHTEVMRITKDGVFVNPNVAVDDVAKTVLDALDDQIKLLVQKAVEEEREACAKVCEIGTGEPVQMKTLEILRQERERIAFVIRERGAP